MVVILGCSQDMHAQEQLVLHLGLYLHAAIGGAEALLVIGRDRGESSKNAQESAQNSGQTRPAGL
jgi:hypothetical protein